VTAIGVVQHIKCLVKQGLQSWELMYKIFLKLFSWEHDAGITNKEKNIVSKKKSFRDISSSVIYTPKKVISQEKTFTCSFHNTL
jgi:hypothetical protein